MPYLNLNEFAKVTGLSRRQISSDISQGLPVHRMPPVIDLDEALRWRQLRGKRRDIQPDLSKLQPTT